MHQLVLITALSAASGLFATRTQCPNGQCGATWTYATPAPVQAQPWATATALPAAPAPQRGYVYSSGYSGYAPASVPAPAPVAPAVPAAGYAPAGYAPVPYGYSPNGYLPAAGGCATGNCPRR